MSDKLTALRIGGVPEHFNLPWHVGIENGEFRSVALDAEFVVFGGGTGAMIFRARRAQWVSGRALAAGSSSPVFPEIFVCGLQIRNPAPPPSVSSRKDKDPWA